MSDPAQTLIDQAIDQLRSVEAEMAPLQAKAVELRHTVNGICKLTGREPLFPDPDAGLNRAAAAAAKTRPAVAPDRFVGVPLATAVRQVLEMRKAHAGTTSPASVDEIYDVLVEGGFEFPSRDQDNQRRGLAVSLAKNTPVFRKLPNGSFGLTEWYGRPPRKRGAADSNNGGDADEGDMQTQIVPRR